MDRHAFHKLSYGLHLVTSCTAEGKNVGCVVNTFQQVASDPVRASVSLHKDNATTQAVRERGCFGVTVLSQSADMPLIGTFGFKSSRDIDKFGEVDFALDEQGMAYVKEHSCARFCVRVDFMLDLGSHMLFVGTVEDAAVLSDEEPMTYDYYHRELRGRTPAKAVSYQAEETVAETPAADAAAEAVEEAPVVDEVIRDGQAPQYGWRCLICGYVIEADELPDDFTCPICGVGKEMFERIPLE